MVKKLPIEKEDLPKEVLDAVDLNKFQIKKDFEGKIPLREEDSELSSIVAKAFKPQKDEEVLLSEILENINQAFDEEGVDEFTEGAEIIAKREKGGRGRMVVWSIYSFDGKRFVEQTNNDYEKYYALIGDSIENKMKKSELSKDSLEYIQLVKDFWEHNAN